MRYLISCLLMLFSTVIATADDRLTIAVAAVEADLVFMRHALAPGFGDPANFVLDDCGTQRNLDNIGRQQAVSIGAEIRQSETQFTEILSSEWCRCRETTELLGLSKWETFSGLNSFFQDFANKQDVMNKLEQELDEQIPRVALMDTHRVLRLAATGQSVGSSELIAFNIRFKATQKFRLD